MDEDNNLVIQVKEGDKESFNSLFMKYEKKVFNLSLRLLGDVAGAEDLSQEVFLHAYQNIHKFRQRANFFTWLYRITINCWKNRVKYEKSRKSSSHISIDEPIQTSGKEIIREFPDSSPSPSQSLEDQERNLLIHRSIEKLPPNYRIILILRDIEDRTYEEVARVLRCRLGTVKSRLARAREELRKILLPYFREGKNEM